MSNTLIQDGVEVSVTANSNGRPVKIYAHEGRFFIESREGTEYAIEIKNNNSFWGEAVAAVEGLSVMNGKKASVSDYGYVIPAFGSLRVKGYRKNLEEVGAFVFTKKEKSYAAADKGEPTNVGVIAVAVWREKSSVIYSTYPVSSWLYATPPQFGTTTSAVWSVPTYSTGLVLGGFSGGSPQAENVSLSCLSCSTTDSFDHGTTWGQKVQDKVSTTTFERETNLLTQFSIFYNSKENLQALGIKLVEEKVINYPTPFPASFATPPSGWKS